LGLLAGFPRPLKSGFEGANLGLMAFGGLRRDALLDLPRELGFESFDNRGDFIGGVEGSHADIGPELGAIFGERAQINMTGLVHRFERLHPDSQEQLLGQTDEIQERLVAGGQSSRQPSKIIPDRTRFRKGGGRLEALRHPVDPNGRQETGMVRRPARAPEGGVIDLLQD
jgi:hypothetical protein